MIAKSPVPHEVATFALIRGLPGQGKTPSARGSRARAGFLGDERPGAGVAADRGPRAPVGVRAIAGDRRCRLLVRATA